MLVLCHQMLLEKLNGTTPCLLDETTVPPNEGGLRFLQRGRNTVTTIGEVVCVVDSWLIETDFSK